MFTLAITLIGSFIIMALLTEPDDDDDDQPGGGIMSPVPVRSNHAILCL